jgi:hypothetical protein
MTRRVENETLRNWPGKLIQLRLTPEEIPPFPRSNGRVALKFQIKNRVNPGSGLKLRAYALVACPPANRAVIVISAFRRREIGQPTSAAFAAFSKAAASFPGMRPVTSR